MMLTAVGMTAWFASDPSDALSGPHPFGAVVAPVVVLLTAYFVWRETRTGGSRK